MIHSSLKLTFLVAIFVGAITSPAPSEEKVATWLKVPEGFKVTQFADDSLATNIYCMTTDSRGRIVVAGPGYIKILLDDDQDGKADRAQLFSTLPRDGAMGLCFDGTDLLCVGDGGLLRFRDVNKDDVADGPPELLFRFKTGGEHDSHAIRKGPDGWWYLISGNYSGVGKNIVSSSRSPVKSPTAGVITRISPDFQKREIFADGMRNAYDFDFDEQGDLFVYDSDGERDVSLPWYRPTRVYRLHPGSHAGWITRSWKRPEYFFDMPTVAAKLGRGSPTGVVCYRHWQFPALYQNSVFVLDWTFGRVIAIKKKTQKGEGQTFENELFVSGKGTHGFAPTDACVGVDGSLYISVGGRSTSGSVYRVRHLANSNSMPKIEAPKTLVDCLDFPQPLSAWSRASTQTMIKKLGREKLEDCIANESLSIRQRVRAVELLTEYFLSPDQKFLSTIADIKQPAVQARLAWCVCQQPIRNVPAPLLFHFLDHDQASVRIAAIESLTGNQNIPSFLAGPVFKCLQHDNLHLQKAAAEFISSSWFDPVENLKKEALPKNGKLPMAYCMGRQIRKTSINLDAIKFSLDQLDTDSTPQTQLNALRLLQISLGDVGPVQGLPQVFESYQAKIILPQNLQLRTAEVISKLLESTDSHVVDEAIRCLGMCRLARGTFAHQMLEQITPESSPQLDIHILAAVAHSKATQGGEGDQADSKSRMRAKLVSSILGVQPKITKLKMNQDRNWEPRFKEIVLQLFQPDDQMSVELVKQGIKTREQIFLFQFVSSEEKIKAIDRFIETISQDEELELDSDLARLLASTSHSPHWELLRRSFDTATVRDTIIELLARKPYEADRAKFVAGLASPQVKTVRIAAQSLLKLNATQNPTEQFALLNAIERISPDKEGYAAREWIMRVLQQNMGRSFGFVFGSEGYEAQSIVTGKWRNHLEKAFPEEAKKQKAASGFNQAEFAKKMFDVDWDSGDVQRGMKLYTSLTCAKCHGNRNRLGPDLAGVTKRFSKEDLFRAIADPSFQVPSRYQTTLFETNDGNLISGIIIYDSVDGVLLRDSDNKTVRIEQANILARKKVARSIMPNDLLKEVDTQGLADLFQYLQTLQ